MTAMTDEYRASRPRLEVQLRDGAELAPYWAAYSDLTRRARLPAAISEDALFRH